MVMHAGQLAISLTQVKRLVADQFPDWAQLPVVPVDSAGTVNALFRIGEDLVARLPLMPGDVGAERQDQRREASRADELRRHTTTPVPVVVGFGEPGHGYPMPWSVQTWLPGRDAFVDDPGNSVAFARDLAGFIAEVRAIDTAGRVFTGGGRGGELQRHDAWVETCLERSGDLVDVPRLRTLWEQWRLLPRTAPDVMSHTDLIPGNVLVGDGRLVGVLDVGGFGPADPALDLVAGWHLLADGPRQVFRRELGCDELDWERGRAWAFVQSIGTGWYYRDSNPAMSQLGVRTIARLLLATT